MSYVLVTNDDGIDSPALLPLLDALGGLGELRAVVPDRERSWIGKAITRWEKLRVRRVGSGTPEIHTVDGFPADCAHLGIQSLFDAPPRLVVSGINIGLNYGSAFFYSSGTVGAAIEAWIAGVPAVAFSIGTPGDDRTWKAQADGPQFAEHWRQAAALCSTLVASCLRDGLPEGCDLLSVNFPVGAGPETPREVTRLADACYTQLFRAEGDGIFAHDYRGAVVQRSGLEGTDVAAVAAGRVSITPIALGQDPALPRRVARQLLG